VVRKNLAGSRRTTTVSAAGNHPENHRTPTNPTKPISATENHPEATTEGKKTILRPNKKKPAKTPAPDIG
jgi:hypothetical protein